MNRTTDSLHPPNDGDQKPRSSRQGGASPLAPGQERHSSHHFSALAMCSCASLIFCAAMSLCSKDEDEETLTETRGGR
ncbi:hypothetical protein DNTS_035589 [Danionella cerebrum]|uniref:Uncharacterized protein n=1 Tax=Danionella cerebrum TaxID=2873325 RepID=A0A553NKY4_9TELE|nr:hypothetical protein DNTS_035589 [Danionella translucida]